MATTRRKSTRSAGQRRPALGLKIVPGHWTGIIVGTANPQYGMTMQGESPAGPVEFSFIIIPVMLKGPEGGPEWPGVAAVMAPTGRGPKATDAGTIAVGPGGVSAVVSLDATREQFSDIDRSLHLGRLKKLQFTVMDGVDEVGRLHSWGLSVDPETLGK